MNALIEMYGALVAEGKPELGTYRARKLDPATEHRVAIDATSAPFVLIDIAIEPAAHEPVPLRNIVVRFERRCRVVSSGHVEERAFAAVGCTEDDDELRACFLRVMEGTLPSLGPNPEWPELISWIRNLLELFASFDANPSESIQGLWGELFIIHEAPNPEPLLAAWHATPQGIFDFSDAELRIDVKTTTRRTRQHRFLLDQLRPPPGADGYIASLLLDTAGEGATVYDLLDEIAGRAPSPALVAKAHRIVAATLGNAWRRANETRFDTEYARAHARYYRTADLPAVALPLPEGVSNVHLDLFITATPLPAAEIAKLHERFPRAE